jgi:hypothetical protein
VRSLAIRSLWLLLVGLMPQMADAQPKAAPAQSTAAVAKLLPGAWRMDGNPKFTRTFRADGAMVDLYEGDESATVKGKWRLLNADDRDPLLDSAVPGTVYLRVESGADVTFYAVVSADRRRLRLQYTDRRGFVQNFTRVPGR